MPFAKQPPSQKPNRTKRILLTIAVAIIMFALLAIMAFKVSPWPSALLIRQAFNKEAIKVNEQLKKYIPPGVAALTNQQYNAADADAKLDLYYPEELFRSGRSLPLIVWIHGGGLISGDKGQVASYCQILAAKGFIVAAIDYTIAPEAKYPTPLRQTNAALAYLQSQASQLHIDTSMFFLAGDSGGSHIASQTANIISDSSYAALLSITPAIHRRQLAGLLLFCGIYDIDQINLEGSFGGFMKTVLWSYSGRKDFQNDILLKTASVTKYIRPGYPPCFISAGNGDPLLPQSKALAYRLGKAGVPLDTLFFPASLSPALPHEYQFNLDTEAGKKALERSVRFVNKLTQPKPL